MNQEDANELIDKLGIILLLDAPE